MAIDLLSELKQALPARYKVDAAIGSGGQGSVFRGTVNGSHVAVKLFSTIDDPRRIQREIDILRRVDCPSLVKILDADSIRIGGADMTVVAYELHTGGDLTAFLRAGSPHVSEAEVARIGCEVGAAIDALWAKRIVHRDIKPANIVRAADGRSILVDVGLARHLDRSGVTGAGLAVGTAGYMSPEQARGRRDLTIHSDAFSLGVTLYELAAHVHPFGRDQGRIVQGMPPANLRTHRGDLSPAFCRAIDQMMSPRPSARPKALAAYFSPFLGGP